MGYNPIRPNQTPIHSPWWMLQLWKTGLSASDATRFEELPIKNILASNQAMQVEEFVCTNLNLDVQKPIATGSTLVATKKI